MKKFNPKNQSGDALITALFALVLVGGLALLAAQISKVINDRKTVARAKSIMTSVQQKILDHASEPSAYTGCDTVSGVGSCSLNLAVFKPFTDNPTEVPGSQCEAGHSPCGIEVDQLNLDKADPSKPTFKARIRYTGNNFSLHPIEIAQVIPKEVLQATDYDCTKLNGWTPLFTGLVAADGKPRCRGIPYCGDGKYIDSVNSSTLEPNCQDLPSTVSCDITQFISSFNWLGGANKSFTCAGRVDPYTVSPWWDGGSIDTVTPTSTPTPTMTTTATPLPDTPPNPISIDAIDPGPSIGSVLYYMNSGVVSFTFFRINFKVPVTIVDCKKISFHNDIVGYDVGVGSGGTCKLGNNGKSVIVRAMPHCYPKISDVMCNGHIYTLRINPGAVKNAKGTLNDKGKSLQFVVDPH